MTDAVNRLPKASTPIGVGLDGAALLRVSREVGLREWMHGINATAATAMLLKFVAAANAAAILGAEPLDQRVAFETWAKAQGMNVAPLPGWAGEYEWSAVQNRWDCWQGAVAAQRQWDPSNVVPAVEIVRVIDAMEVAKRIRKPRVTQEWEDGYAFAVEHFNAELQSLLGKASSGPTEAPGD